MKTRLPKGWHSVTPRTVTDDEAGAKSLEEPIDTPYGDRRRMVEDRWGNVWQIATFQQSD